MDILELVDRLEELFNESRAVPFTHSVMVDEDRFLDLIDQMRVTIPEEVRKAQQLLAQRERILAQAKEEAQRTIQLAQQKREEMLSEHRLVEEAQRKAAQIIAQAEAEAERIRREADRYALESLEKLAVQLDRMLTEVQNGIRVLQEVQQERPPEGF
ncbi:MAG TPA: ATPase [Anaerolineae bacterium]|nr:ATPase [Anaerolineae bacterium]HID84990.1 ATPase [Anaerolineales bacterium]HIQ09398.1 ATPase [Anaerolineaceae bacterium]